MTQTDMVRCGHHLLAIIVVLSLASPLSADDSVGDPIAEIKRLEDKLFNPAATEKQIDALLKQLSDKETRSKATTELRRQGIRFTAKIVEHARTSDDVEVRHACAYVVALTDSLYRTGPVARQLAVLYKKHLKTLLPDYWKRFRKDPTDQYAVAMIMSGDPEVVAEWLKQSDDKIELLRYLLLRVRERSPDEYAKKNLPLFSDTQVEATLADVFPVVSKDKKFYCYRVVGHVAYKIIDLISHRRSTDETFTGLYFGRSALALFRSHPYHRRAAAVPYGYNIHSFLYPANGRVNSRAQTMFGRRTPTRGQLPDFPGLYRAVELKMSDRELSLWLRVALPNPWWIKKRVPEAYRRRMVFSERKPGEQEPVVLDRIETTVASLQPFTGTTKTAPASAPSVVILPPRLPADAQLGVMRSAEAACDRLAGELSADGTIQIVNRSELAKILEERKLPGSGDRPITSYAAMIRLEVETTLTGTRSIVNVIDLSTGTPLKQQSLGWPLTEADVDPIKRMCQSALKNANREVAAKTRVRWLGVENTGEQVRMKPLAARLQLAFSESLTQSKNVLVVQHLEAKSSQEESLLLLMGLSRLPDGKRFTPQADATVELRVTEGDGVGKTFEETPVTIGVRLRDKAHPDGDWVETAGIVRKYDPLIQRVWQQLAERLTAIEPDSAGNILKEFGIRRSQAETELRKVQELLSNRSLRESERNKLITTHLETALKIDPTFPEPHLMLAVYYSGENAVPHRVLEAVKYVEHPHSDPQRWAGVMGSAARTLYLSRWFSGDNRNEVVITEENRSLVPPLKLLIERGVDSRVRIPGVTLLHFSIRVVDRGMLFAGAAVKERTEWVDGILRRLDFATAHIDRVRQSSRGPFMSSIHRARLTAAELAIEDGLLKRGRRLLGETRVGIKPQNPLIRTLVTEVGRVTRKLNDPQALQEFEAWSKPLLSPVGLLAVNWPKTDIWKSPEPEMSVVDIVRQNPKRVVGSPQYISPIAVDGQRAYLMTTNNNRSVHWTHGAGGWRGLGLADLAVVPLDKTGRPVGQLVDFKEPKGRAKTKVWEPFHVVPPPPGVSSYGKLFVVARNDKLYLGTHNDGLLVFDPNNETWKSYGPKEGLPKKAVSSFYFLNDDLIYAAGGWLGADAQHYTLKLSTGEVKLLHKANANQQEYYSSWLVPMWRENGKLVSRLRTGLLSAQSSYRPNWRKIPLGSSISAVKMEGRRFFTTSNGLYEYDGSGKAIRSWLESSKTHIGVNQFFTIPGMSTLPPRGRFMVRAGRLLVFAQWKKAIVAFDPKTETWYGPLGNWDVYHAVGASNGCWLAYDGIRGSMRTSHGTLYLSEKDLIETAEAAGRVYTSAQYGKHLQDQAETLPLLDRAKVSVMLRDHKQAAQILNEFLESEPKNTEALFLRGLVHDRWGMSQPEQALADYRALTQSENPSAIVTGLFFEMMVHQQSKNHAEIVRVCERLNSAVPNLDERLHRNVEWWLNHAKKAMK